MFGTKIYHSFCLFIPKRVLAENVNELRLVGQPLSYILANTIFRVVVGILEEVAVTAETVEHIIHFVGVVIYGERSNHRFGFGFCSFAVVEAGCGFVINHFITPYPAFAVVAETIFGIFYHGIWQSTVTCTINLTDSHDGSEVLIHPALVVHAAGSFTHDYHSVAYIVPCTHNYFLLGFRLIYY